MWVNIVHYNTFEINRLSNKIDYAKFRKILKTISNLIENGILTSKDIQKEISTDLKFKKDKILNRLNLVSREEFEILKKIVQKQDLQIRKLQKNKKIKKVKKP